MRENNNGGPLTGRAMALRPIREAAVFLLVLAALLLTPGKRAAADVIWTPDDSFYDQHYEDCDYEGRRYYANGADGYVTVMESPEKRNVLDVLANGPVLYVSMTYDKGMSGKWGLVQYVLNDEGQPAEDYSWDEGATVGWIKMEELLSVYDGYSFAEEHRAEIQETDEGAAPKVVMPDTGTIYLWEYPGSEISYGTLESMESEISIDQTYQDPGGDLWGHSGYYFGYRNFWINLSDPGEAKPELKPQEKPKLIPPADRKTLESLPKTGRSGLVLPLTVAGLIVLTIVLTALVIRFMAVKKRDEEKTADGGRKES